MYIYIYEATILFMLESIMHSTLMVAESFLPTCSINVFIYIAMNSFSCHYCFGPREEQTSISLNKY